MLKPAPKASPVGYCMQHVPCLAYVASLAHIWHATNTSLVASSAWAGPSTTGNTPGQAKVQAVFGAPLEWPCMLAPACMGCLGLALELACRVAPVQALHTARPPN